MTNPERPTPVPAPNELSPDDVHQTYEQLGLNDPEIRRRLLELAAAADEQPRVGNWLHADAGTGSIY